MNKQLIELNTKGLLEGDAAYIFMQNKPLEELYDLSSDPYEVNNLADSPNFIDKLLELRNQLSQWQIDINDRGFTPESELIKEFWPNMVQPTTSNVIMKRQGGKAILSCKTKGSSIAFQTGDAIESDYWQLYTTPINLKNNEKIRARAIRIGYKASNILTN
jgi:hypothetical protein